MLSYIIEGGYVNGFNMIRTQPLQKKLFEKDLIW